MARHKNLDWKLADLNSNGGLSEIHIQIALLMDLRDELQRLNSLLHCPNFIAIPRKLDRIMRNTTRKRRKAK
jgi:hypothetical protein